MRSLWFNPAWPCVRFLVDAVALWHVFIWVSFVFASSLPSHNASCPAVALTRQCIVTSVVVSKLQALFLTWYFTGCSVRFFSLCFNEINVFYELLFGNPFSLTKWLAPMLDVCVSHSSLGLAVFSHSDCCFSSHITSQLGVCKHCVVCVEPDTNEFVFAPLGHLFSSFSVLCVMMFYILLDLCWK